MATMNVTKVAIHPPILNGREMTQSFMISGLPAYSSSLRVMGGDTETFQLDFRPSRRRFFTALLWVMSLGVAS